MKKHSSPETDDRCRGERRRAPGPRWVKWLSYGIAAGAFAYVLLNLRLSDLAQGISGMVWWPVVLAIFLQMAPRVIQAWRWGYLLRPARVRLRLLLHAIYVGTLLNGLLPLCPSDLVRGAIVARRTEAGAVRVVTSQALERVADGIVLVLVVWFALRGLKVPPVLDSALWGIGMTLAAGLCSGLVVMLAHRRLHRFVARKEPGGRLGVKVKDLCLQTLSSLKAVRLWTWPLSLSAGLMILTVQVVTLWLIVYAYHIELSLFGVAALFGIITIGTLIPNAPGKIGAWQFFCILGLGLFEVPAARAASFSMVAFAIWTVPSLLLGVVAMIISPVSWTDFRKKTPPGPRGVQPA